MPHGEADIGNLALAGGRRIEGGRAPVGAIISRAAAEAIESNRNVAVLVYEPTGMANDARAVVYEARNGGCRGLEYFEETYQWVAAELG
ncbi:hypothetical protein ASPCAL08713 [Aspergillus calidoustus]|uniref:Uncharacterized protein n=1 Tax=Aspergillus calidoustus TaxID=454130 RepID=A0A0U5GSS8_ASPCI|nr:hypothetical protein ASPCAL08713 [Aspergillus calidoustus]